MRDSILLLLAKLEQGEDEKGDVSLLKGLIEDKAARGGMSMDLRSTLLTYIDKLVEEIK